jgi:rSAM/selenodomain-associated transferase 1
VNKTQRVFGVFTKYWQPGFVKTRLAEKIGNQSAATLHFAFLQTILRRFASIDAQRQLCFDPAERLPAFRELAGPAWELVPQYQGDLGMRLQHFFGNAFKSVAKQVIVIGSDSPNLPVEFVNQALQSLEDVDVVLGPSLDGGYYLIGLSRNLSTLFDRVSWSTRHVWQQTVDRLTKQQVPFVQLPPWYDVDDLEGLERLLNDLRNASESELRDLFETIQEVVES